MENSQNACSWTNLCESIPVRHLDRVLLQSVLCHLTSGESQDKDKLLAKCQDWNPAANDNHEEWHVTASQSQAPITRLETFLIVKDHSDSIVIRMTPDYQERTLKSCERQSVQFLNQTLSTASPRVYTYNTAIAK